MCAGHIINELVTSLLASASIAAVFRDGLAPLEIIAGSGHDPLLGGSRRSRLRFDRGLGRILGTPLALQR